ncbi:hypothetical protein GRAN_1337 [Granulicella sibirica]|uniref:Uncharacterized protein n=1 Tax=Granulicella sibirica TaxID=2479048 RepID=A0A4Q0T3Z8_9BACT|nr:hypothetical protein GRAN_1337 [Granulicella sibirica]
MDRLALRAVVVSHVSRDETAANMGHPGFVAGLKRTSGAKAPLPAEVLWHG